MPDTVTVNTSSTDDMPAWAIRLEGKVDLVVAQQTQRLNDHGDQLKDHELRLRSIEGTQPEDARHRLRAVEERKTVAPAQLWTAVVTGIAAVGGASTAISILIK